MSGACACVRARARARLLACLPAHGRLWCAALISRSTYHAPLTAPHCSYINGQPFVVRDSEQPLRNLEYTGIDRGRVEGMEARLKADVLAEVGGYGWMGMGGWLWVCWWAARSGSREERPPPPPPVGRPPKRLPAHPPPPPHAHTHTRARCRRSATAGRCWWRGRTTRSRWVGGCVALGPSLLALLGSVAFVSACPAGLPPSAVPPPCAPTHPPTHCPPTLHRWWSSGSR